jgi:hypothetical protein
MEPTVPLTRSVKKDRSKAMQDDTTTNEENQELNESQEVDEQNEQDVQEVDNQEDTQVEKAEEANNQVDETPESENSEGERPPSRRETKRIQQLIAKMQNQSNNSNLPSPNTNNDPSIARKQRIIDEGEYDLDEINQMAGNYANEMYQKGLSQAQQLQNANMFSTRLEIDTPQVMSKHTFLDPSANDFNPSVADMVNRMYLNLVGFNPNTGTVSNPNIRYGEFVDGYMDTVDMLSSQNRAESSKNIAKQVANSGVRPNGVADTEYQGNNPKKMSDKQLDDIIKESFGF